MGNLRYGHDRVFGFDDRTLAHLRSVILVKLQRQESFVFTWSDRDYQRSIWLHPGVSLEFEIASVEGRELNRYWIEALADLANTPSGLRLIDEPRAKPEVG